ncbi:membrane protein insertase YidC [Micromonospora sp. HM5-17]|uniref:YidC/Oxa1 family membrane protein insertase n=1 Tax=Micromonospora sp. HM5-17 TaxID=2487710 RepID=UPI000F47DDFC|nr:membrane protein insertase YidC [Micromonospora sp. HM5-17]ROT32302.1 membrane protein insertase YidC [Micromonospora sp. HM5-17]
MSAFAPLAGAVGVAAHLVTLLATLVQPAVGTAATAAAVVLFTVLVRLLISPLSWAQIRGQQRSAALAPRIRELRRRYADQPDRFRIELVELYRSAGVSPVAGCLPALAQWPFFLVMYQLFAVPGGAGDQSGLLAAELFGVPLGHRVGDGLPGTAGPLFGVLLILLVLLAWWSSRRMRKAVAMPGAAPAEGEAVPGAGLLTRVMPLLPYGTVVVALVVPLAAVLYLVTTTAWTGAEQAVLRRVAGRDRATSPR